MVELREEKGVQRSLTERLVRSRLQWAGHVERMADDRLPKRAAELCEQGRRRRGRPNEEEREYIHLLTRTLYFICTCCITDTLTHVATGYLSHVSSSVQKIFCTAAFCMKGHAAWSLFSYMHSNRAMRDICLP